MFIVYIPRHQAECTTFMPMAFKEKSVQPEMVGGGKKNTKTFKNIYFLSKNKKVKSFKYLIYRLTLASHY